MFILTGGAGFIGSCVLKTLNERGINEIIVVDRLRDKSKWKNLNGKNFHDFVDKDKFLDYIKEDAFTFMTDAFIHMGACSSTTERNADYLMKNNYQYSRILTEYCVKKGIRMIYASSAATYGSGEHGFSDSNETMVKLLPVNAYGFSKHVFDKWANYSGNLDHICGLKFFNVFGPNEYHKEDMSSVVYKAYKQIMENGSLKLFKSDHPDYEDGMQMRDFVYVKDCAEVVWKLINNPAQNGIYNVGTGKPRTWIDLGNAVFKAMGKEPSIQFIEMPEKLKGKYQYYTCADNAKLNASPSSHDFMSLEDSVKDYVINYLQKDFMHC
ncbi:MAG: ADP-glyceromanno-heptose 6-epimerase [Fibrobacterota bacterium]